MYGGAARGLLQTRSRARDLTPDCGQNRTRKAKVIGVSATL